MVPKMLKVLCYCVCLVLVSQQVCTEFQNKLDDYISHYEKLHYDSEILHQRHLRYRRSTTQRHLVLKFEAFNRDFELLLEPDDSIFTPDCELQHSNGLTEEADISFIYKGKVKGEPDSYVHGSVIEGVFRGFVIIPGDTVYHIESSKKFLTPGPKPYHSVIYKSNHLNLDPYRHRRAAGEGTCGVDRYRHWMYQKSVPTETNGHYVNKENRYSRSLNTKQHDNYQETVSQNGKEIPNKVSKGHNSQEHRSRNKRNVSPKNTNRLGAKNTCYMYLRSDPVLWNYFKSFGAEDSVAKNEILSLFASHVAAINIIYKSTDFTTYSWEPSPNSYKGVRFRVQRTSVLTNKSESCNTAQAKPMCNPDIDVSNFLDLTSRENHDRFCLAFTFTARDFSGGTLGLAWVASPDNSAGGICEKNKAFPENGQTVKKSLNTGIVTFINYGKRVPPAVSHLTFAHEVGHNFGSPHDTGYQCAPFGTSYHDASQGNYIMYASATNGDLPHNREFSVCSKDNITRVLHALMEETFKKNCLENQEESFCGNGIVEEGEKCDCGYEDDCDENCCNPRHEPQQETDCQLKTSHEITDIECSPSEGPCCTDQCQFVPKDNQTCRPDSECVQAANCSGTEAACPPAANKSDIVTLCNDDLSVCEKGVCSGSLCKKIGYTKNSNKSNWEECSLASKDQSNMCYLACREKGNATCISSASVPDDHQYEDFRDLLSTMNLGQVSKVSLPAGSPCDDYKGYCDVFSRCRGVNNDGPLARLQNLIFGTETWTMIREWIIEHWWIVLLISLGIVLFMLLFIKVCGVNTPSYDPKHKQVKVKPSALPQKPEPKREATRMQDQVPRGEYLDDGYYERHIRYNDRELQHIARQKY